MRNDLHSIALFILVLWLVFVVDALIPAVLTDWGLRPRTPGGLVGIPLMPLLHGSFGHLLGNTFSLMILLGLLSGARTNSRVIVLAIIVVSGLMLWLFGRNVIHVGASALVFGLISFLIVSGVVERRLVSLAISLLVGVLYGGTLLMGLIPRWGSDVSWDGHLCGVVAGAALAYAMTSRGKSGRFLVGKS
jgi:membrane associated rhomboid family serine protease